MKKLYNIIKFPRVCKRCNTVIHYVHENSVKLTENEFKCNFCKGIPDISLSFFIELGIHMRKCPSCGKFIKCKSKRTLLQSLRFNKPCKSCNNRRRFEKKKSKKIKQWIPIAGTNITYNRANQIESFWKQMSEIDRKNFLKKNKFQRQHFWSHLTRMKKVRWKLKLRKSFEKYRGDNHWMKNPKIYAKVKQSCRKYKGEGHWFKKEL